MALAEGTTPADPVVEQRRKDHDERSEEGSVKGNQGLKKTGLRGLEQLRRGESGDSGQVRWSGCAICWFGLA